MKRNMDLIRQIILETANLPPGGSLKLIEGVAQAEFCIHVQWLHEAKLLCATLSPNTMSPPRFAEVWRLTWDGYEFADAVRNPTLWEKAKTKVLMPSGAWTFGILLDWLKGEIANGLPKIGG